MVSGPEMCTLAEDQAGVGVSKDERAERCHQLGHLWASDIGVAFEQSGRASVIMLRPSLFRDFRQKGMTLSADERWLFPQWSGYRKTLDFQAVERAFAAAGARVEQVHTSGQASVDDLVVFSNAIGARHFVPIHSDEWDRHLRQCNNGKHLRDGEEFEVR